MAQEAGRSKLEPSAKLLSLIPVGLKEAALDSPSFRASVQHFGEQVDIIEKWLESLSKSTGKLSQSLASLESCISSFLSATIPPSQLSEAIIDHDYTLLAAKRFGDGAKAYWADIFAGVKRMDATISEPIRRFVQNDLRSFKEARRQLDQYQRQVDSLQARYAAQTRVKEASSIREDAFQLHEARKGYLKASMDFSVAAPQLRMALDKLLVRTFYDQWQMMKNFHQDSNPLAGKWAHDVERVRGWSREMESSERIFQRELFAARKQMEESAQVASRPSRELDDYTSISGSSNGSRLSGRGSTAPSRKAIDPERQGWLNLRIVTGKPARTSWVRRWFFVKHGIFAWLVQGSRSGGVEESERIGVLLCSVRPAAQEERRYCFEVKTKDTSVVLQAETQQELNDWISTFDAAKRKALEPSSAEVRLGASSALDPAFAISQPTAPEFAASPADSGMPQSSEEPPHIGTDRAGTLPVPSNDIINRAGSFDISSSRRPFQEREGDTSRDPASRLIQKLDLHRKGTIAQAGGSAASGGIASLISASHTALPVGPGAMPPITAQTEAQPTFNHRTTSATIMRNLPHSSLAPTTLAHPPNATNLSAATVIVNGERGCAGQLDLTRGMPSGMMANLWGSSNWGYINRLERGEIRTSADSSAATTLISDAQPSALQSQSSIDTANERQDSRQETSTLNHRQTVSLDGDLAELQRNVEEPQQYLDQYPTQLKHQDAQFHLLFPNVKRKERVVLVFRATWNPNDQQEFSGRVYVTALSVYFYSHNLGLILITGIALRRVSAVTATPGRDHDLIFLHLKDTENSAEFNHIAIKIFLEPLSLLLRRLKFLVQNANLTDPWTMESIMQSLIRLEDDEMDRSPSIGGWDDFSGPNEGVSASQSWERGPKASFQIDQDLSGSKSLDHQDTARLKLPSQPVIYVPRGMTNVVVEREFDISPKALFHVLFGDKSAVWQLLYHERQAQRIRQGPWTQTARGSLKRTFEYDIEFSGLLWMPRQSHIIDHQIIDVQNEHLCYSITDRKTPWHLPYQDDYMLVTKLVITHVAKSKCKLAIHTQVEWKRMPSVARQLVEQKAISDLKLDALDLTDVLTDQVRKLGPLNHTKKAMQIFGSVGQQKDILDFGGSSDPALALPLRRARGHQTLAHLLLESSLSVMQDVWTALVQFASALLKWTGKVINAHTTILALLGLSLLTNAVFSSRESSQWWKERYAGTYMKRLGVGPDLMMSKAIFLDDLVPATIVNNVKLAVPANSCYQTFRSVSAPEPTGKETSTHRLSQTRKHLGSYRHDLMVALRVVNRVEIELLEAEWETWIKGEIWKCNQVDSMLADEKDGNDRTRTVLRTKLEEYCSSCRAMEEILP